MIQTYSYILAAIDPYLIPGIKVIEHTNYIEIPIISKTDGLLANAHYFNHPDWALEYLTYCHRSETFRDRWQHAIGDINNKIIVDIGCGPGNIFATLKGKPRLLIGVDVAPKSLELAGELGYTPVLADATDLPFVSGFADVVTLNATLHHCEDMAKILQEAARLVKPGGLIITDHDPQLSAWNYKGIAKLLWTTRLFIYKVVRKGFHKTNDQQYWALACEIHHKPGHGVTKKFFHDNLDTLGFTTNVYPHNHTVGSEVFQGKKGKAELKYRIGNLLSGRNPSNDESALSLMCVGKKVNLQA